MNENEVCMLKSRLKEFDGKIHSWTNEEAAQMIQAREDKHETVLRNATDELKRQHAAITQKQQQDAQTNQMLENLKSELEKLYELTNELRNDKAQSQSALDHVNGEIGHIKKELESTSEAKKKLEYLEKSSEVFSSMLGLTFKKTQGNKLQVLFTNIDEKNQALVFYFFLQLEGQSRKYVVSSPEPPVEGLDDLVAELNNTNNLRAFFLAMRNKFKQLAKG